MQNENKERISQRRIEMDLAGNNFRTHNYFRKDGAMKKNSKQPRNRAAFTIIELLTVMAVIALLIGLLVPALNKVRIYAKGVKQSAHLHSIGVALEMFKNDEGDYPPSSDPNFMHDYCGAQTLSEALLGRDLRGYHPDSLFRRDGKNMAGQYTYDANDADNIRDRKGPYLELETAGVYMLDKIYDVSKYSSFKFDPNTYVLTDCFGRVRNLETGKRIGMPVLYYKANSANTLYDANSADIADGSPSPCIYDFRDNVYLLYLQTPPAGGKVHPLGDPNESKAYYFYDEYTLNKKVPGKVPHRADSYLLITAGYDGLYGTRDDICNFER